MFPAGKVKYLNWRSQLGWYGGAMQPMRFDDADMEQAYQQYIGPMRARETAFFQKIQVQQASTIAGQASDMRAIKIVLAGAIHARKCKVLELIRCAINS
ncbi:hypothetical protein MUB05_03960 [Acinetobacter indicus]|uniref:hypothetical protein n=1 Tax=Acinetobacter TaxID=469 RepID=UPI0015D15312|nr:MULTISPECIES: hypothetical protein [Acinetobacter]MCP0915748.1 hypothetical protein [Acinetobacter indicus]MCP0918875.1 hypothetical protein [Acinetobacter indicus]MCP0921541.1 hypothetical protein [Acinetobacter indicus]QSQ94091.1 hypothetical protein J0W32_04315 [Acinetobacter indicus]